MPVDTISTPAPVKKTIHRLAAMAALAIALFLQPGTDISDQLDISRGATLFGLAVANAQSDSQARSGGADTPLSELDVIRMSDANVMMFYADWCPVCKALDPKLIRAVETYETARINIVRLDYTNNDIASFSRIADKTEALGMANKVSATSARTGYALIIVKGVARGRIGAGMSVETMHMLFDAALSDDIAANEGL